MRAMRLCALAALVSVASVASLRRDGGEVVREARFDRDPGWIGVRHQAVKELEPVLVRQDFGYSRTAHAGGGPGEIGGFISPDGDCAYYALPIEERTLEDRIAASGRFACPDGSFHVLVAFFDSRTTKEWRTPNTIALRLNGRGDHFFAYIEYCTSAWRAGGDTTPFPAMQRDGSASGESRGFASGGAVHRWSIVYDPDAADGRGAVRAEIDGQVAICELDPGHRADGATFDRFGLMNVVKSADSGGEVWLDDLVIDGRNESFDVDPRWDARKNRDSWRSRIVRPRWDVGFRSTNLAGGREAGEIGGTVFRGDCRYEDRMASFADTVGPLDLERPLRASGRIAMTRGVSDSTTLFGFFHSERSMARGDSQREAIPECVLGIHVEGPSSEGFFVYPVCRAEGGEGHAADSRSSGRIRPDGRSHEWSLEYDPRGAEGRGVVTVTLDGHVSKLELDARAKSAGTTFDRFGILTSWIDGNSQDVYWDDLVYTVSQ